MTLYLTPAWMTSGLMRVAEQRPEGAGVHLVAERAHGGLAAARVVVADRPGQRRGLRREGRGQLVQHPAHHRRHPRLTGDGQAADRLGGHDGGVVVAGHGAVAPRAVDVIRYVSKPFSATWIG